MSHSFSSSGAQDRGAARDRRRRRARDHDPHLTVNAPPTAAFNFTPANPDVGDTVSLNASAHTDDLALPNSGYAWDLDNDGQFDDALGADTPPRRSPHPAARPCGCR